MNNILAEKWRWFIGLGIIAVVLGFLALLDTVFVTLASVVFLGILLLMAGFAQIFHACSLKEWKGFLLSALAGLVYIICGILLMGEPVTGSVALTIFIAVCFCVGGVMRIIIALDHRNTGGWGFLLFSGILGVILGLFLGLMPWQGLWLIGFMIAFDLMFIGFGWIQLGFILRKANDGH